jgi:enterochelin esterase-like enzyme
MSDILDWQLVHGPAPAVLTAAGVVAAVALMVRRDRRWWLRTVPFVAGVTVLVTALLSWVVDGLWQPFPDALPLRVTYWIWVALFAIALAVAAKPKALWWRVPLALIVLVTATVKINAFFGYYPSLRAALGMPPANEIAFASLDKPVPGKIQGSVTQVAIPSPESRFKATRNAYVYVPPAYPTGNPPVLILLHGQPGGPSDWINGGQIAAMMDRFAAAHHGMAPVVVMPDATGGAMDNPLCADTKHGNSETYLAKDVPAWIRQNLRVDPDSRHWAVGGYSYGGTCALQLALRHPETYPTFLDSSGQLEPTLGSRARTVAEMFGGDQAAFRRINPADLLASKKFPGSAGVVTVGTGDHEFVPQQRQILDLCKRNGLDVTWHEVPGVHNWQAWAGGLEASMDWLAGRMGLVTA